MAARAALGQLQKEAQTLARERFGVILGAQRGRCLAPPSSARVSIVKRRATRGMPGRCGATPLTGHDEEAPASSKGRRLGARPGEHGASGVLWSCAVSHEAAVITAQIALEHARAWSRGGADSPASGEIWWQTHAGCVSRESLQVEEARSIWTLPSCQPKIKGLDL